MAIKIIGQTLSPTTQPSSPVILRNKSDPTQSYRAVNKMYRDIENRYHDIKVALRQLFDMALIGREREVNAAQGYLLCVNEGQPDVLYQVNSGTFIYDMSAPQLADLLERVQAILDDHLLEENGPDIWALEYVAQEYQRGTLSAYTNLSVQSPVYAAQTTLASLLSSPAHLNQIASAYVTTYRD